MIGLLGKLFGYEVKPIPRVKRSWISEPINIVTGALGAGKTLLAIEQADLLRQHGDVANIYQVGINEPDVRYLPHLPFPLEEWHKRADAGELQNCAIIVDEFHKWMPERSYSKPVPDFIQEMAEARKRDVIFILLTQSTQFDHFLKGQRLNRHFYVSRKGGMGRATVWEWANEFVAEPVKDKPAQERALKHLWKHPTRQYGHWYVSAKAHRFRLNLPLRIWLVPVFLLALFWVIWKAYATMGPMLSGENILPDAAQGTVSGEVFQPGEESSAGAIKPTRDPVEYLQQFEPIDPAMPWSAPAYQDRAVTAEPDIICYISGPSDSGDCKCVTEQVTPLPKVSDKFCREIASHGIYNPYRKPTTGQQYASTGQGGAADGKAHAPRPPAVLPSVSLSMPGGDASDVIPSSGAFRP